MFGWGKFFPLLFLVQFLSRTGIGFQPSPFQYLAGIGYKTGYSWKNPSGIESGNRGTMMMMASMGVTQDENNNKRAKTSVSDQTPKPHLNSTAAVTFHVVGDAYVDFFSFLDGEWPESGGDSRLGEPVKCYAGGSSVNTATHLKALITNFTAAPKPEVVLHTVLNPDDQYGQMLMDHTSKHGIPVDNRKREGDTSTTGHCIAIVSGGERSFMTHQGVVENFTADDLDVEEFASTPTHLHLHIAGFYNIPGFWNGTLKRKLEAVRKKRKERFPNKNTTISLVTQHDATKEWDGGLRDLFPLLDFVLMNDLEARSIISSGRRRTLQQTSEDHRGAFGDDFEHEHLEWADYFGSLHSTSKAIVTRGEKGSVALRGKKILSKQKPIVMNSIDPTGAGDSFTAGFIFGLWSWKLGGLESAASDLLTNNNPTESSKHNPRDGDDSIDNDTWPIEAIEEGMRWGVSLASAAVMIRGASVPPERSEIQKFLRQAKQPEYPPSSTKAVAVPTSAGVAS
uniref:Carbohydrate kinase PfkB domain-containing protein n=1 Tax=Pseudo-nitzschia delicatissima TaxID=44447 RepID=A0A7S0UKY5_9STRA|mmetsp:Transcript_38/g.85  ORF Transcript_38/g.85 Transcript_38/m.85 type:complete len:509 (+) Transcript_38:126-1652(+)